MINTNLLFCVKHTYSDNHVGELHSHPCFEFVYYCEGSGTLQMGKKTYSFKKDDFMISSPNTKHLEIDTKGTTVLYIGFEVIGEDINIVDGIYHDDKNEYYSLLNGIYNETKNWNEAISMQLINHYNSIIALKLKDRFKDKINEQIEVSYDFKNITKYIEKNYTKDISVKELANISSYSYDYFRKLFYKEYGKSVNDYINEKRISLATELLKTKEFSINEIASACGFNSVSYFCTLYKKKTGFNPKTIKKHSISDSKEIVKDRFSN